MQPTYVKDDFLFYKENNAADSILGDRLVFDPSRLNETLDYINKNNIKSITINPSLFKVDTLEFLKYIPAIEGLYILPNNLNISIINMLSKLRVLRIGEVNQVIDFINFPNLEVLSFTYSKHFKNLHQCQKLFWLWIEGYKRENLLELKNLKRLKYLHLHKSTIINLEGIEDMSELYELTLDTVSKLESLNGLSEKLKKLEILDIWSAKNLDDYENIAKIKSLRQLELRKTGESKTIGFLKDMPNLKKVTLGFKVTDGNMSYLKGVKEVGFIEYKHYTHKMKDFLE